MPRRTHSRHLFANKLRSQLAGESVWAIHPPKLNELLALADQAHLPGQAAAEIQAAFGVREEDPSRIYRIGNTAVLPITGMIQPTGNYITRYFGGTSLELLEKDFRAALADSQVKSIVLFVDSYGGNASQNDEVSRVIYNARGKKPIVAFVRGGCCSAAYYLASAADSIVASSSSMIGSVGTIAVHQEFADYLAEAGIKATVITHGKNKGHGNAYEKLSTEARASLQKTVDDFGNQFEAAVARNRGVNAEQVANKFGQGQAFLAAEAKTRGLVDQVGTWEQVLSSLNAGPAPLPTVERENTAQTNESESSTAAAASAATSKVLPPVPPAGQEVSSVDPRIKAMLFARGLITSIDASDEICKVVLNSYFVARNESAPATAEATIAALSPHQAIPQAAVAAAAAAAVAPAQQAAPTPAPTPAGATQPSAAQAEQQRILDLQAAGSRLSVSAELVTTAITTGVSYENAVKGWMNGLTETHRPVNDQIRVGQDGSERFAIDAGNAMALRMGCTLTAAERNPHVERLQHAPMLHFAQESLRLSNTRVPEFAPPELIAEMALQQGGPDRQNIGVFATSSAVNRPGDFPNLMSNLFNKMLEEALDRSEVTFPLWTGRVRGDLPDFKAAPMIGKGQVNQLDEVLDAEEFKELAVAEELLSYMQLGRYGNAISLTPVMVANDDLGAFEEDAWGLQDAHDQTLNRLPLNLIIGNVTLLDNVALYHATHANVISAAGGGPTAAQWQAMNLLYNKQTTIGATGYISGKLKVALVPPNWGVQAEQTFMSLASAGEDKVPITDATINVYRKHKVMVVEEPELQRNSDVIWYGFADPVRRPAVKVAYFRGWGRKGRRERWYDPGTKCQKFSLEGRFGAAATQYRTTVRNVGQ